MTSSFKLFVSDTKASYKLVFWSFVNYVKDKFPSAILSTNSKISYILLLTGFSSSLWIIGIFSIMLDASVWMTLNIYSSLEAADMMTPSDTELFINSTMSSSSNVGNKLFPSISTYFS